MPKSAQVKLWFSLKAFLVSNCGTFGTMDLFFFHSNHKVHSVHMALSHLWFAFVSCLKQSLCSSLAYLLWNATSGLRRWSPLALRSGSRGYFRSECCTGGRSMKCMNNKMTERLSDKDVLPFFLAKKMSISTLIYRSAGDAVTFFLVPSIYH